MTASRSWVLTARNVFYFVFFAQYIIRLSAQEDFFTRNEIFFCGLDDETMACCERGAFFTGESVEVNYTVTRNEVNGSWSLGAIITWDAANSTSGPVLYEVEWQPVISVNDLTELESITLVNTAFQPTGSCDESLTTIPCQIDLGNSVITDEPRITYSDVLFGLNYRLRVRVLDEDDDPIGVTVCVDNIKAADCYTETGDESFCRGQPIIFSSYPFNVTISTARVPNADDSVNGTMAWRQPLQLNGRVELYSIHRSNLDGTSNLVFRVMPQPNDTQDTVYELLFPDLINDTEYQFTIAAFVEPELGNFDLEESTNINVLPQGNRLSLSYRALVPDLCSSSSCLNGGVCVENTAVDIGYSCVCIGNFVGQFCEVPPPSPQPRPPPPTPGPFPVTIVVIIVAVFVIIIAAVVFAVVFIYLRLWKSKPKDSEYMFSPQFRNRAFESAKNRVDSVAPEFKSVEIFDYAHIKEGEQLGSGQYGEVFKGEAKLSGQTKWSVVAIKKPKNAISEEVIEDFKNEIRLMLELGKHPNIVGVLGCCTVDEPYYLLTDFMNHGDLLHFLRECTNEENMKVDSVYKINTFNQLQIARQIADGMAYVSQTRFFHGDLAARNILVADDLLIKITDFGLTDDLYQKGYTRLQAGAKRPYKWYSPESIEHQYCTGKTDIWSFGVLLWEILTFGRQTPYHGMSIQEVLHKLKSGYRMPCPPQTPDFMAKLVNSCWMLDPEERPEFPNLLESISFLLEKGASDVNYIEAGDDEPTPPTEAERKVSLIYTLQLVDVDPAEVSGSADSAYIGSTGLSASSFLSSSTFSAGSVAPIVEEEEEEDVKESQIKRQGTEVKVDVETH